MLRILIKYCAHPVQDRSRVIYKMPQGTYSLMLHWSTGLFKTRALISWCLTDLRSPSRSPGFRWPAFLM